MIDLRLSNMPEERDTDAVAEALLRDLELGVSDIGSTTS